MNENILDGLGNTIAYIGLHRIMLLIDWKTNTKKPDL